MHASVISWSLFEKFVSCRLSVLGLLVFGVCFVLNKPFTGRIYGTTRVFFITALKCLLVQACSVGFHVRSDACLVCA